MHVTRSYPMDIGYLLDGTPVAQKPQDEQTDPARLLRSLSSLCLGFMPTCDVVVPACVALSVRPANHSTHSKSLFR